MKRSRATYLGATEKKKEKKEKTHVSFSFLVEHTI